MNRHSNDVPTLGQNERKEVAGELWRIFCTVTARIAITYDQDGITIRIPLGEHARLGDGEAEIVYAIIEGYTEYTEHRLPKRHA